MCPRRYTVYFSMDASGLEERVCGFKNIVMSVTVTRLLPPGCCAAVEHVSQCLILVDIFVILPASLAGYSCSWFLWQANLITLQGFSN